jgi:hypothetical protein
VTDEDASQGVGHADDGTVADIVANAFRHPPRQLRDPETSRGVGSGPRPMAGALDLPAKEIHRTMGASEPVKKDDGRFHLFGSSGDVARKPPPRSLG